MSQPKCPLPYDHAQSDCDSTDYSLPGSSVHRIPQERILESAGSLLQGSTRPRDRTHISCVSCIGRWILYHWAIWEAPRHRHTSLNKTLPVKLMSEKIWKKDHLHVTGPGWKPWQSFLRDFWKKTKASKDTPFNKIIVSFGRKKNSKKVKSGK